MKNLINGKLTGTAFAPVYLSADGYEWMGMPLPLQELVRDQYKWDQSQCPGWAKDNKLVRVAKVQVTELE